MLCCFILLSLFVLSVFLVLLVCWLEYNYGGGGGNIMFIVIVQVIGYCGVLVLWFEYMLVLYQKVIDDGVDIIELDFVFIKDGVLVVCYENEIFGMINVVDVVVFVGCKIIKMIDGQSVMGWFIEDFMLGELKMLCVCECILSICFDNVVYNDQFDIFMFDEIIVLVWD